MPKPIKIFIDSACRGNPGASSFGVIAHLNDGIKLMDSGAIGKMTNQEGEFFAVGKALEMAIANKWPSIEIYTDSRLVVQASTGKWKLKSTHLVKKVEHLLGLAQQVKMLGGDGIKMQWLSREDPNIREVDELCNRVLNPSFL